MIILIGNGMCGYVLARCFTNLWMVSLAAGSIAIVNPLVIQDINKLGLRQTLLWWVLLFPALLKRGRADGPFWMECSLVLLFFGIGILLVLWSFCGHVWSGVAGLVSVDN